MVENATLSDLPGKFDDTITRLQVALDDARRIPEWGVFLVVLLSLLSVIILLHVLALIVASPCLWAMWARHKRLEQERLLTDEITDPDTGTEMSHASEADDDGGRLAR